MIEWDIYIVVMLKCRIIGFLLTATEDLLICSNLKYIFTKKCKICSTSFICNGGAQIRLVLFDIRT